MMNLKVKPGILRGMSENGPVLPPEVYRRRRIVAFIALIAVILLLVAGVTTVIGMISNKKHATVASTATATGAPFQSFSPRPSEVVSESASASASAASASESASSNDSASATTSASASETTEATASASESASASATTLTAMAACTANDLKVTVTPAKRSFGAGEQVSFDVTYTNSSKTPCFVGGEGKDAGVDLDITSGSAQVYTQSQCSATTLPKAEVAAGAEASTTLVWDRTVNALGCSDAETAEKGSYWATATVNGVTSSKVNFLISK